jgi:aminopeptidase N
MTTQPVLLAEYKPPAFLVSSVDLAFDLDPAATKVVSRLALRRNPNAGADEPLRLNGEALTLLRIARDGQPLDQGEYRIEDGFLIIAAMPDSCMLEIEAQIAPAENTELSGLYVSGGA